VYAVDRILSGHPAGRLLVLGGVSFVFMVILAVLRMLVTSDGVLSALYWSVIAFLDPTSFASEETYLRAAVGMIASFLGLAVVASLIGLISSSIEERLEVLQKGKSRVISSNHILILCSTWSENKVMQILREFSIAATSRVHSAKTVVILSEAPKSEVEDIVYSESYAVVDVIVRTGSPTSIQALLNAGADRCSCVVLLNPSLEPSDKSFGLGEDNEVLKTLLALRKVVPETARVVCELAGPEQLPILPTILPCRLDPILMADTLARILVQTCRVKGLSEVLADLLTFEGSELYFAKPMPELTGLEFSAVQGRLYGAVPLGLSRAAVAGGKEEVVLNPDDDVVLRDSDRLLILAESGTSFSLGAAREVSRYVREFRQVQGFFSRCFF
jgi:hypothetical protein